MDLDTLRNYCLSKKGATEDFPFDDRTLVFRVANKMFALTDIKQFPVWVNLKCDPVLAEDLRREFSAVKPGYHMDKRHWNTVEVDGSLTPEQIFWMIDMSYELVLKGLKKSDREAILAGS